MKLSPSVLELERCYARSEALLPVTWNPSYGGLVAPNGNGHAAVHRWFHLKEAFSNQLLARILREIAPTGTSWLRVLDPYAGVGTTAVSLADSISVGRLAGACFYGMECNGFLHLVASTKLAALQRPPRAFETFAQRLATSALNLPPAQLEIPSLSTFQDERFFDREVILQLLRLHAAIVERASCGEDPVATALATLCLGAIIEPISNLRRDGRALRRTQKRDRPSVVQAFIVKAREISADLPKKPLPITGRVIRGDGRIFAGIDGRFNPFDIIIFSPPYPNNIDYTEVYKLENWLLGFIDDRDSFLQQRMKTVYSHPSVLRPDPLPSDQLSPTENDAVLDIIEPLQASLPHDRYYVGRRHMIRGYARDMFLTLKSARSRLAPQGRIVYIVGNSVHGTAPHQFVIAADLIIAQLALTAGLAVERIAVARYLRRRHSTSRFLRESVVFLRN